MEELIYCMPTASDLHVLAGDRNNFKRSLVTTLAQRNDI